tara:strand:- start:42 stop:578 length:537 start_codon:yes stop_codon:yes gene_type:complete
MEAEPVSIMNFDEIKQILDLVREHELTEFELERDNFKIRVQKGSATHLGAVDSTGVNRSTSVALPKENSKKTGRPVAESDDLRTTTIDEGNLVIVKSPIVGTLYLAPEPGAEPFVEIGATVQKGQVLCIIEAMKLMNEINSDLEGEVVKAFVESGQPVQYGEHLFAIRPTNVQEDSDR